MKRLTLLLLFAAALFSVAHSSRERVAMVVQTKGNNTLALADKKDRLRTLQVLPEGAKVIVRKGAKVRLSYFSSGRKETIYGPCEVGIGERRSVKLQGQGSITARKARGVKPVVGDKNLRRMGGALQANATLAPKEMLAMVNFPEQPQETPPTAAALPQATRPPAEDPGKSAYLDIGPKNDTEREDKGGSRKRASSKPKLQKSARIKVAAANSAPPKPKPEVVEPGGLRAIGIPPTYAVAPKNRILDWGGASGPFHAKLTRDEKVVFDKEFQSSQARCGPAVLTSGRSYVLTVTKVGTKESFSKDFYILSKKERDAYFEALEEYEAELSDDDEEPWADLIVWLDANGLFLESQATLHQALGRFSENPGFHAAMGRNRINLGQFRQAKRHLKKVKNLERK